MGFSHCSWLLSLFCGRFVLYAVPSAILSFAIISLGKREMVALLFCVYHMTSRLGVK